MSNQEQSLLSKEEVPVTSDTIREVNDGPVDMPRHENGNTNAGKRAEGKEEVNKSEEDVNVSFMPKEEAEETFLSGIKRKATLLKGHLLSGLSESSSTEKKETWSESVTSRSAKAWKEDSGVQVKNGGHNTTRKPTKIDSSKYRRGPIPTENLLKSDGGFQQTTHGTIDSDDEEQIGCKPSSRGLLVYFARLGASQDEDEIVDLKFVASLFKAGANVNHEDRYGQTSLHAVARDWHIDVARYLLQHGALVDKADKFGRTPLHLAAAVDHHEMVQFLVLNGANVDERSGEGQTPLHLACKNSAVNSIKTLLRLGAQINARDKKLKTPLFIAAETGRTDAARTLLDAEAPAGVYDIHGTSAMACMIEKMPSVAYGALSQFYVDDQALRRKYFYLSQLESPINERERNTNFAKNALEMIVVYKETHLVMHPVIQKMIDVKWQLFARKKSWIELLINLFYTLIWVILAVLIPRDGKFHTPLANKSWRIVLEAIFVILTMYFAIKEVVMSRNMRRVDNKWRDWLVRNLENELETCHPKWPEERKYIESEIDRVWRFRGSYSRNMGWSIYEWCCQFSVLAVAGAEVYYELHPTSRVAFKLYTVILSISVMMICLRLMKICRAFTFLSAFIVLLGHVLGATLRFAFLFFEFFIPYVCILWVIFGGTENASKIEKLSPGDGFQFKTFDEIIYIAWLMTVTADIPFTAMVQYNRELASIIVGTYYALVSVVCINLYIALMSETFTRVYENAEANASLQQALLIIFLERQMGAAECAKIKKYYAKKCSPFEQLEYDQQKGRPVNVERETSTVLGNVDRRLRNVTGTIEETPQESGQHSKVKELAVMNELKKKSRYIRNNQETFINQMKTSLNDVMKVQESITRVLKSIALKAPQTEIGHERLRRSKSSQSIS